MATCTRVGGCARSPSRGVTSSIQHCTCCFWHSGIWPYTPVRLVSYVEAGGCGAVGARRLLTGREQVGSQCLSTCVASVLGSCTLLFKGSWHKFVKNTAEQGAAADADAAVGERLRSSFCVSCSVFVCGPASELRAGAGCSPPSMLGYLIRGSCRF